MLLITAVMLVSAAALLWRAKHRFRQRAMSLDWPPGLNVLKAHKYAEFYLRESGWTIKKDEPQGPLYTVAWKNEICLLLFIVDASVGIVQTQLTDIDECAFNSDRHVMVLLYGVSRNSVGNLQVSSRLRIAELPDLSDAENIMRAHLAGASLVSKVRKEEKVTQAA